MSKTTNNNGRPALYKSRSGKPWSGADISRLIVMAENQVPAARIARKLRHSEGAVRAEAARQRVLLAPSDKVPAANAPTAKHPTAKQPYGGLTAKAIRSPRGYRAPSPSRARAQAPRSGAPGGHTQETLF